MGEKERNRSHKGTRKGLNNDLQDIDLADGIRKIFETFSSLKKLCSDLQEHISRNIDISLELKDRVGYAN